jgi:uncharacterized protein (TIGR00369 family)
MDSNHSHDEKHRSKTVTWQDPAANARDIARTSGLDYLAGIKDGRHPPPPVAMLLGYRIHDVREGFAAFRLDPQECHYNPFSSVHGGILSTLLDTTMTASVLTTLAPGRTCATVEIKVNFIRPVNVDSGTLTCKAEPIHVGRNLATAEGKVKDSKGRLCAHGVCTCSILEVR